ncbi:MAG: translesion error-prone DNA polymerase V autoproteolytic subunit [Alphaproteobacteria bacterium]|nr:translesion error-prone DNA polymerase V autoproteolytic subunit [Alphaproteobacteria bacterium]
MAQGRTWPRGRYNARERGDKTIAKRFLFPFYAHRISAGFPSPADDFLETALDLNQYLIRHPAATFFVKVAGDSMIQAGIHNNDILVVDRSLEAKSGAIVIAVVNGELTVKRLRMEGQKVILKPENPDYPSLTITEEMAFSIWGVVTSVIHEFKGGL